MKMPRWTWALLTLTVSIVAFGGTARAQDRIAVGAQVGIADFSALGDTRAGYGFRFTYGPGQPFVALDTEFDNFPTSSTGNLGEWQFFAGLKAGARVGRRWGIFFKLRPGVDSFGGGADPGRITQATHFAVDLGGGLEYYFAPHLALRWDLSDVETFFGSASLVSGPGTVGTPLGTRGNFQTTIGLLVHF